MVLPVNVGDDGSSPPAGSFKVLGQTPSILVQGGTKVVDAMSITVEDQLYGVTFTFTIPRTEWAGSGTQNWASLYTTWVNALAAHDYVQGLSYTQDVNASGNLVDMLVVTVGTPDNENIADVEIELSKANSPASFGALQAAYDKLIANTALS